MKEPKQIMDVLRQSIKIVLLSISTLILSTASVYAAVLDWDSNTWTPTGSLSQAYSVSGSNVNIMFSDPDSGLTTVADGDPGSPEVNSFQHGGTNENGLFWWHGLGREHRLDHLRR